MSGQEGTRPLQLSTAVQFTPDRGSAPVGHPDNAIMPAARDTAYMASVSGDDATGDMDKLK